MSAPRTPLSLRYDDAPSKDNVDVAGAKLASLLNGSNSGEDEIEYRTQEIPDEDSAFEGEEEEADPTMDKVKKVVKKKKTGVFTREQISAAVAALSDAQQDDRSSIRTARCDFPI